MAQRQFALRKVLFSNCERKQKKGKQTLLWQPFGDKLLRCELWSSRNRSLADFVPLSISISLTLSSSRPPSLPLDTFPYFFLSLSLASTPFLSVSFFSPSLSVFPVNNSLAVQPSTAHEMFRGPAAARTPPGKHREGE